MHSPAWSAGLAASMLGATGAHSALGVEDAERAGNALRSFKGRRLTYRGTDR